MSPLALLESSIIKGDWSGVCKAYKDLTGVSLKPPGSPANVNIPQVAKLLSQAMSLLQDEVSETVIVDMPASVAPKKAATKKAATKKATKKAVEPRPEPEENEEEAEDEDEFVTDDLDSLGPKGEVRCSSMPFRKPKGPNKFKDDGTIAATFLGASPEELIEESRSMGKTTRLKAKKQAYRQPQKTVKLKCTRCPKTENVPEGIVKADEYVCNSCSAAGGFRE